VAWLCQQLGVARSGFYAWRQRQEAPGKRAAENAVITAEIEAVFEEHRGFYPRFQERCHPCDQSTRGLEDMTNASLQRGRQS